MWSKTWFQRWERLQREQLQRGWKRGQKRDFKDGRDLEESNFKAVKNAVKNATSKTGGTWKRATSTQGKNVVKNATSKMVDTSKRPSSTRSKRQSKLFNRWPAELADHCDIIFHGSDIIYSDRKNGHPLSWPPSGGLGALFPKDYWLPCPRGWCRLVPVLLRHGGHSLLPLLHSVYYARLLALSSISSMTGSVLKNCSTITSIGTSFPWGRDCFVDVNAGHSLHKCQAVSISSSRQHWHVWSVSLFHFLIWWPNRPWPVMAWKMTPKFFLDTFFMYFFLILGLTT